MSIILQKQPKLLGITQRKLVMYVIQFAVFFAIPYLLFSFGFIYYIAALVVLLALNLALGKQIDSLYSLIVYYGAKKRYRS